MEQKTIEQLPNYTELEILEVINTVTPLLVPVIHYLAVKKSEQFPFLCSLACNIIKEEIEDHYSFKLTLCNGSRTDITDHSICRKHTWLEYGNLIIDPTDFQFSVISNDLPLTNENIIPKDVCLDGLDEEELYKIFLQTYAENRHEEYLKRPNEKEKRFQELTNLLKDKQTEPKTYTDILRDEYGFKAFYNKSDKDSNIIYTTDPRDAAEFYSNSGLDPELKS